jgi:hypothetical protein
MRKRNSILKVITILLFILVTNLCNAQVTDALLTAEMNNGNNPEISEITADNWRAFEKKVGSLLTTGTVYAQVYLELVINGVTLTIVPDYLVLQSNGKYKVIDAKASAMYDLSSSGTPNLTSKCTSNQQKAYPAINLSSITAKVKTAREPIKGTGTLQPYSTSSKLITLEIGVDFYVNTPKAQYSTATKRTL